MLLIPQKTKPGRLQFDRVIGG
ncbi:hypothetical protein MICRO116_810048 [Micrococcus sp. 116]|nr:hypothetical protein MICRO116_810048 [Micrococcus sp. 116]